MITTLERLVAAVERSGTDIAPSYIEYTQLAYAIATDCGEAGREAFHRLCRLSTKYDARNADRLFSAALKSGNRGDVHLATAFWLAKNHGVEVKPLATAATSAATSAATGFRTTGAYSANGASTGNGRNRCKDAMHAGAPFLTQARVPYIAGATAGGTDAPSGGPDFPGSLPDTPDSLPDEPEGDPGEPLSDTSEPYQPLPVFPQDYAWPAPIGQFLQRAETAHRRDVLLLGMLNVIGCTLAPHLRTLSADLWTPPTLQTFIVAPPASGKGILTWCRYFVEPLHERIRREVDRAMEEYHREKKAYELMGRDKAKLSEPQQPPNRMFLIAGDNSSTGIAQNIIDSGGNGLIVETEADTVSAAIGADYGKWSHLLRDFFDHARISFNRRINQEYREIGITRVGVLLSGTPAQVPPLIPSAENGLFSRQLFYYMPAVRQWRNQFGRQRDDIRARMRQAGEEWMHTLDEIARQGTVTFVLTEQQEQRFNDCFSTLFEQAQTGCAQEMGSSLIRLAVNVLRIAMVTAALRHIERHGPTFPPAPHVPSENVADGAVSSRQLGISDEDFQAVLSMVEPLYRHATHILSFLQRCEVKSRNMSDQDRLLSAMPAVFSRKEWLDKAAEMGIPKNTALSWLQRLQHQGVIGKLEERGMYSLLHQRRPPTADI